MSAPYVRCLRPAGEPAAVEAPRDTEPEALTVIETSGAEAVDPWGDARARASDEAEVVNDEPELTRLSDDEPELTDDEPESESESEPELAERARHLPPASSLSPPREGLLRAGPLFTPYERRYRRVRGAAARRPSRSSCHTSTSSQSTWM